MRYYLKDRRGFTLVEVLVATVILGILVAVLSPLIKDTFGNWQSIKGQVEIQGNLRQVVDYIAKELRQADPSEITLSETDPSIITYAKSSSNNYYKIYLDKGAVKQQLMALNSEGVLVNDSNAPATELTSEEVVVENMEFDCIVSDDVDDRDQYVIALSGRFVTSGVSTEALIRVTPRVDGAVEDTVYDE